jgi:hypothetical protein
MFPDVVTTPVNVNPDAVILPTILSSTTKPILPGLTPLSLTSTDVSSFKIAVTSLDSDDSKYAKVTAS